MEDTQVQSARDFLEESQQLLKQLKANLQVAQDGMKFQWDQIRSENEFEVGNLVSLKLKPYK